MTPPNHTPASDPAPPSRPVAHRLPLPAQYLLALTAVGLSVLGRSLLDPYLGDRIPFILTLSTLAVIAWLVRPGPYALAAIGGVFASDYLFIEPRHAPGILNAAEGLQLGSYLFMCAGVGAMAAAARASAARAIATANALRQKDLLLGTVAHGSATLLAYVDTDLRYRFVNDAYCRHFGVRPESVLARTVQEQIGPEAYERLRPHLDRVFAGESVAFEADVPYPTIGQRRMRIAFTPHLRADGYVAGYTAALHDVTEERLGAEALRRSEERFRLATEALDGIVYDRDQNTGIVTRSAGLADLIGIPADAAPRTAAWWASRIHPDDLPALERGHRDAAARRDPGFECEYRVRHDDGRWVWVWDHARCVYAPDGSLERAVGCIVSIDARRRAEDRLRRNHETFVRLIENAPFGVYVVDSDFRLRQVSAGSRRAFAGVEPLLGRDYAEVVRAVWPEPFASEVIGHFRRTLETGEPHASPDTTERRTDTHETESYDWKVERITLPDGTHGVVCYFYDMTERRRQEQALRDSERRLQAAYAELEATYTQSPLGMGQIDRDFRFVRVNDALALMNGVSAAGHVGRTVREIVPGLADQAEGQIRRVLRTGEPLLNVEVCAPDPADPGSEGTRLQSWYPLRDADGGIIGVSAVVQDITERKRVENELARYRQHLERLVRERTAELERSQAALRLSERMAALGTFAAGLGHDITNTLLPLRVRVEEVLADPGLDQRAKGEILAIVGFLKYLQSLARGLRLFAQDPDRIAGPEERTDLTAWCADTLPFFRASVPAPIELACDIPPDLPQVAVAPHRLSQAVLNLVHNARDAVAAGRHARAAAAPGRIAVVARAGPDPGVVSIAVTDNGTGMTDEVRRRCLEPFFSTKTRGMGGTGLGLSMVHGIAAKAGAGAGALEIDTAPGRGTTVTLRLPVVPADPGPDAAEQRTAFITVADKRIEAFTAALAGALGRRAVTAPPPADGERPGDCWIADAAAAPADRARVFVQRTGANRLILLGDANGSAPPGAVVIPEGTPLGRIREALAAAAREEVAAPAN